MKNALCLLSVATILAIPTGHAASIIESYSSGTINLGIPDGNPSGLANVINVPASGIGSIQDISVTLNITGTWNGDLYATLQHSSGFAVLLNRVGRTAGDAFGFGDGGFNIVLNDLGGFDDIHNETSGGGLMSGTFGSDGRLIDPDLVVDTDPRTALLTSFDANDANGNWTLFVADLSGGDPNTLVSWGVEITGQVPEPGVSLLLAGSALLAFRRRR